MSEAELYESKYGMSRTDSEIMADKREVRMRMRDPRGPTGGERRRAVRKGLWWAVVCIVRAYVRVRPRTLTLPLTTLLVPSTLVLPSPYPRLTLVYAPAHACRHPPSSRTRNHRRIVSSCRGWWVYRECFSWGRLSPALR